MDAATTVDLETLDDPQFLAARSRVRLAYELSPGDHGLALEHQRMTAEFDRRASAAWQQAAS
jgi:hypothetical protein